MKNLKLLLALLSISVFIACSSSKNMTGSTSSTGKRAPLKDDRTFKITKFSDDATYAYTPGNPVMVGGVTDSEGPTNERRFLNALSGPNGEEISYEREGSCCPFKTPNGIIENSGMLDKYVVTWSGQKEKVYIYINMYDFGDLKCPKGLNIRSKNT